MLAKLWKKVLLAACIIACIFNIMSKLVSRTSLELNLKSVENGESILSVFKNKEESEKEDVANEETTKTESSAVVENTAQNEANVVTEQVEETTSPITDFVVIY